jgi:hypothetical protein
MAAFLLAGLLGFFGEGVAGHAVVRTPTGEASVEYPRFARVGLSERVYLRFHVSDGTALRVLIAREYLDDIELDGITPAPVHAATARDGVVYMFDVGGVEPTAVEFLVSARRSGRVRGTLHVNGLAPIYFTHLVFP